MTILLKKPLTDSVLNNAQTKGNILKQLNHLLEEKLPQGRKIEIFDSVLMSMVPNGAYYQINAEMSMKRDPAVNIALQSLMPMLPPSFEYGIHSILTSLNIAGTDASDKITTNKNKMSFTIHGFDPRIGKKFFDETLAAHCENAEFIECSAKDLTGNLTPSDELLKQIKMLTDSNTALKAAQAASDLEIKTLKERMEVLEDKLNKLTLSPTQHIKQIPGIKVGPGKDQIVFFPRSPASVSDLPPPTNPAPLPPVKKQ